MSVGKHNGAVMLIPSSSMPSSYARMIARVLNLNERGLPELLIGTGLTSREFLQDGLMITAQQQVKIIENALVMCNEDTFGLRVGQELTPETHGAMGLLAHSSPDLLTALRAFQTYSPTRNNFSHIELVETDDWVECYYSIDQPCSDTVKRCMSEAAVMSLFANAKFIVGDDIHNAVTVFAHHSPPYTEAYSAFLPGVVEFGGARTVVRIPAQICVIPNTSSDRQNYLLAMRQCDSMLGSLHTPKDSCKYQVQKLLLSNRMGGITEEAIASELFVSKRTLARRLSEEGTGFRQLRDEILSQQASSYLSESELSVEAIAALLGYHDSSNFRRAFKRWFDVPPDQYRRASTLKSRH